MEKDKNGISRKKIVISLLLILPVLWAVCGILQGESLEADMREMLRDGKTVSHAVEWKDENGFRIGEERGAVEDFVRLSNISLKSGIYRIAVEYDCTGQRTNSIRTSVEGGSYRALLENEVGLFSGLGQMDFLVWLREGTDSFSVHADYAGQGDLEIQNIRVYRTNKGYICALAVIITVYLAIGLWMWWKRTCGDEKRLQKGKAVLLILAGITVTASLPLAVDYSLGGADMGFHLLRIEGLMEGMKSGQFPVRIQPQWLCGHGYATSIFYCDTFLLFPALLRMIGFPVILTYQIYMFAVNLATAWISYACMKRMFDSRSIGVLGSAVYTLAPYRLYDLYSRNAVGEYTAMIFLPVICLGFWEIFHEERNGQTGEKKKKNWLPLALGLTGIIQSHVISCELAGGFAVLLCIILWRRFFRRDTLSALVKAAGVTVLLNLWYLVPFAEYYLKGDFVFHHAFSTLQHNGLYFAHLFYVWPWGGDNDRFGENGMTGTAPVTVGAAILACVVLFIYWRMHVKPEEKSGSVYKTAKISLILGSAAMFCSLNFFPWDILQRGGGILARLISTIQFPMRFLAIAIACLCVHGCAAGKLFLDQRAGNAGRFVVGGVVVIAVVSGMFYTNDMLFSRTNIMRLYTAENMGNGAILGSEYLPWGTEQSLISYSDMQAGESVAVLEWQKEYLDLDIACVNEGEDSYIDCPMLYYVGYRAQIKDSGAALQVTAGNNGLVRVWIPAGFEGEIRVWFAGKWYWRLAEAVSFAALAALAAGRIFREKLRMICGGKKGSEEQNA